MSIFEPYAVWSKYDDDDLREYVDDLLFHFGVEPHAAPYLFVSMCDASGRARPLPAPRYSYPRQADAALISGRAAFSGEDADDLLRSENERLNKPIRAAQEHRDPGYTVRTTGTGVSRRTWLVLDADPSRDYKKARGRRPFHYRSRDVEDEVDEALWRSGCIQIQPGRWVGPSGTMIPWDGPLWYATEVWRALSAAESNIARHEAERAAYHAIRAGELRTELLMKVAHDQLFKKAVSVEQAQRESGKGRRKGAADLRRDTWRKYRDMGDKAADAGRNAARELGVSEATIRRSFPGERYPADI